MSSEISMAQDIIRCTLCDDGANYHCPPCAMALCDDCIPKHLSTKNKRHEILECTAKHVTSSQEFECLKHKKNTCEIYCKDCKIEICAKCVTGEHREHNFTDIEEVIEERKETIFREIRKVEATTLMEFQEQAEGVNEEEYEDTTKAIFAQQEEICKAVKEVGSKLREQVHNYKMENKAKALMNAVQEKKILHVIQSTKALLGSNDSKAILGFKGVKSQLPNQLPDVVNRITPKLQERLVKEEEIHSMFGLLVFRPNEDKTLRAAEAGEDIIEQPWFHGFITREEAEYTFGKNGDFLIRKKGQDVKQDQIREVGPNGTVVQFVHHLQSSKATNLLHPARLIFQVDRHKYQLDYNKISLGKEIHTERGQRFFKGTFNDQAVLIATNEDDETTLFKNVSFLRFFNYPKIVRFVGYSAIYRPTLLVLENMPGISLRNYLRRNGPTISVGKKIQMCKDVADGIMYIHLNKFVHRDVAAHNCMISFDGMVQIFDFRLTEEDCEKEVDTCVAIKWTAPEALKFGVWTFASDIWSFGVLMWEVFSSGQSPYPGMPNAKSQELIEKGYRMESPKNTPRSCYNLMLNCWEEIPRKRCPLDKIVEILQTIQQTLLKASVKQK